MLNKIWKFIGEHKLLIGAGTAAAGLGYLVFSPSAHAAAPPPRLPGTTGVKPIPGGGLAVSTPSGGTIVIPPPAAVLSGNALYVTTRDPAPEGNLNARAAPNGQIIGYYPKDGPVEVLGGPEAGFLHVRGPGIQDGEARTLEAWASMQYLQKREAA